MKRELGDGYELDDDPGRVDVVEVHRYLSGESYWAAGRPYELAEAIIRAASRVVGLYHEGRQVGFCRAITAVGLPAVYLADVYVLEGHRGRGFGRQLVEAGSVLAPVLARAVNEAVVDILVIEDECGKRHGLVSERDARTRRRNLFAPV